MMVDSDFSSFKILKLIYKLSQSKTRNFTRFLIPILSSLPHGGGLEKIMVTRTNRVPFDLVLIKPSFQKYSAT